MKWLHATIAMLIELPLQRSHLNDFKGNSSSIKLNFMFCSIWTDLLHPNNFFAHVVPWSFWTPEIHSHQCLGSGHWNGNSMCCSRQLRVGHTNTHWSCHDWCCWSTSSHLSASPQLGLVLSEAQNMGNGHSCHSSIGWNSSGIHHHSLPHPTVRHTHHALRANRNCSLCGTPCNDLFPGQTANSSQLVGRTGKDQVCFLAQGTDSQQILHCIGDKWRTSGWSKCVSIDGVHTYTCTRNVPVNYIALEYLPHPAPSPAPPPIQLIADIRKWDWLLGFILLCESCFSTNLFMCIQLLSQGSLIST